MNGPLLPSARSFAATAPPVTVGRRHGGPNLRLLRRRSASQPATRGRLARLDWSLLLAASVTMLVGLGALYWSYRSNLILAYGDSAAHLNIARHVLDSRTPGIAQLGTVWLPIPHLLMQPFVWNDFLWRTGLAGSIVGLLCFEITAIMIFLSIRLIARHELAAWVGVTVFVTNPSALYLYTTALTEPVLLMAMTASGYFLLRWSKRESHRDLLIAGVLAAVAIGSRFDGWFFFLVCAPAVAFIVYFRWRDPVRTEGVTLAFMAFPLYAMFLWFFYNWLIWGNPLQFNEGQDSAAGMNGTLIDLLSVSTRHHLLLSALTYNWCVLDNLGVLVTVTAAAGLAAYLATTRLRPDSLVTYTFLSAAPFNIISLSLGQTLILIPQLRPSGYFNVRYGILLLPAAAIFTAYLADFFAHYVRRSVVISVMALALIGQGALWIPGWPSSVITIADGLHGVSGGYSGTAQGMRDSMPAARYFRAHYHGGGALAFTGNYPWFFPQAGIDFRQYIDIYNGPLWTQALQDPTPYVEWVVLHPGDELDMMTLRHNANFIDHYALRFQAHGYAIYSRG